MFSCCNLYNSFCCLNLNYLDFCRYVTYPSTTKVAFPSSHSSLKVSSCETPLSAAVSAPASRDAMTCVELPVEQPYCSADETRLYTIRCVMNCSAYDSNYCPMMCKNTTFSKCRYRFVHSQHELGEAPKFRDAKS